MNIDQLKYNLTNNVGLQAVIATLIAASGAVKTALTTLITTTMSTVSANVTALMAGTYGGVKKVTTLNGATGTITLAAMRGGMIFASYAGAAALKFEELTAAHVGLVFTIIKTGSAGDCTIAYSDDTDAIGGLDLDATGDMITLTVLAAGKNVAVISSKIAQ